MSEDKTNASDQVSGFSTKELLDVKIANLNNETENLIKPIFSLCKLAKPVKVSVILPFYKGKDTIERCVSSIMQQKFTDLELIILDDNSGDYSFSGINQILSKSCFDYSIIIHETNHGIASTLNEGVKLARGDYVFIVHQDCELRDEHHIEEAVRFLDLNPNVAVVCGSPLYPASEFNFFEKVFMIESGHFIQIASDKIEDISFSEHKCDLFRKEVIMKCGGFDSEHFQTSAEDQMISWEIKNLGYRIVRNHNLKYFQRYGKSVSTLAGVFKKIFCYSKTQSGVILLTHGMVLNGSSGKMADQRMRIRNRLFGIAYAILFLSSFVTAIFFYNPFLGIASFGILLIRVLHLAYKAHAAKIKTNYLELFVIGLVGLLADIAYLIGFSYGTLSFLRKKKQ